MASTTTPIILQLKVLKILIIVNNVVIQVFMVKQHENAGENWNSELQNIDKLMLIILI